MLPTRFRGTPAYTIARTQLEEYYGARFAALSAQEQDALQLDIVDIIDGEGLRSYQAVRAMDDRTAGEIESYARALVASCK